MSHNIINEQVEKEAAAPTVAGDANPESDLVWGGEAIGKEINRTKAQVYHLIEIGALDGAVSRLGYKTYVGSRRALHKLPFRNKAK
jgi:hypothetical protein